MASPNLVVPAGFRFLPDPEELLNLLSKKQRGEAIPSGVPVSENLLIFGKNAQSPFEIAQAMGLSNEQQQNMDLHFFTTVKRISKNGVERSVAEQGKWKTDRSFPVKLDNNHIIGYLTILKFEFKNRLKIEPAWLMREYKLNENAAEGEWVICKIKRGKSNTTYSNNRLYRPAKMPSLLQLGYRFKPTDHELVDNYLYAIVMGKDFPADVIDRIVVYGDEEPWKIFQTRGISKETDELYFFTKLKCKFDKKGNRGMKDRQVGCGTWIQQGKILVGNTALEASRTTYNFCCNDNSLAGWIMHEFTFKGKDECAVCRIYWHDNSSRIFNSNNPSPSSPSSTCRRGLLIDRGSKDPSLAFPSSTCKRKILIDKGDPTLCPSNKKQRTSAICKPDPIPIVCGNPPLFCIEDFEPPFESCAVLTGGEDRSWDMLTWDPILGVFEEEKTMGDIGITAGQGSSTSDYIAYDHLRLGTDENNVLVTQREPAASPADQLSSQPDYSGFCMQHLENLPTLEELIIPEIFQPEPEQESCFESIDDILNFDINTFLADCVYVC